MSLREQLRGLTTRSLYFAIFVAMVGTLSLSFVVFQQISFRLQKRHFDPVYNRLDELQMENARRIWREGGREALANYLTSMDRVSRAHHYLLDARGIDLVDGSNRAAYLPPSPSTEWRIRSDGLSVAARRSEDGQYWFAAVGQLSGQPIGVFLPYYFLVIGVTGLLCWLASVTVVSPIRRVAASIALFGRGRLSVRVHHKRHDEIGQLGDAFNQMADRLERMIVSERRLLADISHELRSPLARLKFAVKLARTSADRDAALDRINRDVDRISALVAGIVEITRAEGDPAGQAGELVRIGDVLEELIQDCALEAEAKGCRITWNGPLGSWEGEVLGSRELLRRAVENILRNGIRYAPEGSTVDVSVVEDEDAAKIAIRDYGPGVPETMLAKIFDPFFRVEDARDALGGGSGLGLSIAKRAVEVHAGTIVAENASPGLRVEIKLPVIKAAVLR